VNGGQARGVAPVMKDPFVALAVMKDPFITVAAAGIGGADR
jgi:hypothetical protein